MDLKVKKEQYQKELDEINNKMNQLRAQIAELNQQGRFLELDGNKILGKIQAIEDLEKENEGE